MAYGPFSTASSAWSIADALSAVGSLWFLDHNGDSPLKTFPAMSATAKDTSLDFGFLTDLALKTVYADTSCTTQRGAGGLGLPVGGADRLLQRLYREHFIEIRGPR